MKNLILTVTISISSGFFGAYLFKSYDAGKTEDVISYNVSTQGVHYGSAPIITAAEPSKEDLLEDDFVVAASKSRSSVVFIKTLNEREYSRGGWLDWFFEGGSGQQQIGGGSGVIYSQDGYIITNNHVIDQADVIEVIYGKRTYRATLIGTDPSTDLAVIKVEAEGFPSISRGSSDKVRIGEWVLAIGNPFNLTSTVTAGIVSAKGRNINLLRDKFPIESFIQTDAAINPGNSGGALVNRKGELIGINTAILSKTGSYAGYGFAVPVDIVSKVVKDLIEYGEVQKAFFGADFHDLNSEIAESLNISSLDGVLLTRVQGDGAADKAGLDEGDVVIKVNNEIVDSSTRIEELLANSYPGDKMSVTVRRGDKELNKTVELTNIEGTTTLIKREIYMSEELGVEFEMVPKVERDLVGIESGIKVTKIHRGAFSQLDIPEGFIITHINGTVISDSKELSKILDKIRGRVIIEGISKAGRRVYYPYYFR